MAAIVCHGDARALPFPDDSIDLVVTSPPFWGLRSYQDGGEHYASQIGSEDDPREFVASLLDCTREMARVLKPSGSIFVNLGDKYSGAAGPKTGVRTFTDGHAEGGRWPEIPRGRRADAPPKSLLLLPELYRVGCVYDLGLSARAVIVHDKPNGLPESVRDRVRRSHEDWVHLTKSPRYFQAVDELREPHTMRPQRRPGGRPEDLTPRTGQPRQSWSTAQRDEVGVDGHPLGKLPGSVWRIPTVPLNVPAHLGVDHFAAFNPEWPKRLVTGWCPREVCTACGEGRAPISGRTCEQCGEFVRNQAKRCDGCGHVRDWKSERFLTGDTSCYDAGASTATDYSTPGSRAPRRVPKPGASVLGGYACGCPETSAASTPGIVLDPFGGTGTTALVADVLGRVGISLDASEDYGRIARWRTTDEKERAAAAGNDRAAVVAPTDDAPSLFDLGSAS